MAEVSRIIIKTSTATDTPGSGVLNRGELAYSYQSNRLFIGDENSDSNYVIGGTSIFESFNDIVDESGVTQAGIVFANNVIIAGPNKDLDELDIKKLKLNGEELLASSNNLNLFSNIDDIIIANTLPNVSHTQLVSAQAIKEYVDIKTDIISDFINGTPAPAQLLIGNEQSKFEYVDVTGAVEFYANGYSTLRNSSVTNSMIEDAYVQIGLQKVELGKAIVPNLNLDTSGILKVNRGGTGKSSHPENQLLIGNNISEFTSSENLIYDSANQIFTVKASTLLDDLTSNNITVNGYLLLNGDTNISSNTVGFSGNTQVIIEGDTIIEGATFNITNTTNLIIEGDTNYYSNNITFSNTTTVVVEGDTYYYSNNVTISNNTTFSVTGNTTVSGDSFFISNNTSVEISGNTIISGDTFNISNNTVFDVDGSTILNGDTTVNGDVFISNTSTTLIEGPLISNNTAVFNGDVVFNNSPSFEEDVFFQKNIKVEKDAYIVGDLYVSGNTVAVEAQRVLVEDNILVLGANNTTDFVDLGFVGQYDGNNYAGIIRSALEDKFYVVEDYFPEPNDTLHNFNENTMLGILRGNFEADRIEIASGNANNITITNSFADDFHIDNGTANTFTSTRIDVQTMYPQLINAQTVKVFDNLEVHNDFRIFPSANTKIYGEVELINSFITLTNSDIYIDPNSSLNIDGIFDALTVNAASYSGIYLNMIEDVTATATANQVLTADGTGSFYFSEVSDPIAVRITNTSNAILSTITNVNDFRFDSDSGFDVVDLGSGAVKIQMNSTFKTLKVDGEEDLVAFALDTLELVAGPGIVINTNPNASPYKTLTFSSPSALSELTDVDSSNSVQNEILTAYGNGVYYFSNTANLTSVTTPLVTTNLIEAPASTALTITSPDDDVLIDTPNGNISLTADYDITLDTYSGGNIYIKASGGAVFVKSSLEPDGLRNLGKNTRPWNVFYVNDIQSTGTSTLENITANNITANAYSGIYLDMLEDVNSTATANLVLIADGTGNFYFDSVESLLSNGGLIISNNTFSIDADTEFIVSGNTIIDGDTFNISSNTSFNVDGSTTLNGNTVVNGDSFTIGPNTELRVEGSGFIESLSSNTISANSYSGMYLNMLEDVDASNPTANQVLTSYGNGQFFFSSSINSTSIYDAVINNSVIENSVIDCGVF